MTMTTVLGPGEEAITYRLGGAPGEVLTDEQLDYRLNSVERPLVWIGSGLSDVGLEPGSVFKEGDPARARALSNGLHPGTGEELVKPKVAVFEDSKVPVRELLSAVNVQCERTGMVAEQVLSKPMLKVLAQMERAVERKGDAAKHRADEAGAICDSMGLDVEQVWAPGVFEEAFSGLYTTRVVHGPDGTSGEDLFVRRDRIGNRGYAFTLMRPVPVANFITAVNAHAVKEEISLDDVLTPAMQRTFREIQNAVDKHGTEATHRPDEAGAICQAIGLEFDKVWKRGVYKSAFSKPLTAKELCEKGFVSREELVARRERIGNRGYDFTVTLPKSLSILLASVDEDKAAKIEEAFTRKAYQGVGWLEKNCAYGMRGKHGGGKTAERIESSGFIGWAMPQRTARPMSAGHVGDPHWHVHVSLMNMCKGTDDQWSTIAAGGRDLMRHTPAADKIIQALVRHQLHSEFGIEFARSERTSQWEVSGISDETIKLFSKRGQAIEALLKDLGLDETSATRAQKSFSQSETRMSKDAETPSDQVLRSAWRSEANRARLDLDQIGQHAINGTGKPKVMPPTEREIFNSVVQAVTDAQTGLTGSKRRFSRVDAIAAVADASPIGAASIEEIEELTDRVLEHKGIVKLDALGLKGRDTTATIAHSHLSNAQLYTTTDVVLAETQIAAFPQRTNAREHKHVSVETADMAIGLVEASQGFKLSTEQAHIARELTTSAEGLQLVVGPPGTGKTTLLRAARVAWEAQGIKVAGAATAAVAAQNLHTEAGIESKTIAQWLHQIENGKGLKGVDVLVIDEAGMTDDRARAALYKEALKTRTKIVEVGDPKQLRGVGCGSMFAYMTENYDALHLSENRRQRAEDERRALDQFRAGQHTTALRTWRDKGALVVTADDTSAASTLAAQWMAKRAGAPDLDTEMRGLVILSATNERVDRLNQACQAVRAAQGELGAAHTYRRARGEDLTLHEGDLVMVRKNLRGEREKEGADVFNGYRAEVTGIDDQGRVTLAWSSETEDGPRRETATVNANYVASGGLELGYAMTTHKAQGLTVSASWDRPDGTRNEGTVLFDPVGADTAGAYVALSRHKGEVVVVSSLEGIEDPQTTQRLGPPTGQTERVDRAIDAWAQHLHKYAENANDKPVIDADPKPVGAPDLAEQDRPAAPKTAPTKEQTKAPVPQAQQVPAGREQTTPAATATVEQTEDKKLAAPTAAQRRAARAERLAELAKQAEQATNKTRRARPEREPENDTHVVDQQQDRGHSHGR